MREPNPLVQWRVYYVDLSVKPPSVHSFDNIDGTPSECEAYQDRYVVAVFQKSFGGRTTDRIHQAGRYIHLKLQDMGTGSSLEEIAEFKEDGIEVDANLNGVWLPAEIYQKALAIAETDDDFPNSAETLSSRSLPLFKRSSNMSPMAATDSPKPSSGSNRFAGMPPPASSMR